MILVTGANGKTGRAVIASLAARGLKSRALTRSPDAVAALTALGAAEAALGCMSDPEMLRRAARGVRAIYHICPNFSADEELFGRNVVAAAEDCGVRRLVYHSVLQPAIEAMPHHWSKMRVEEALRKSSLAWTIVQPAAYMQNLSHQWREMVETGVYLCPYKEGAEISLVDLLDLGRAAATVIADDGHEGAVYKFVGTPPLTQTRVAEIFGEVLGRPIRAETEPKDTWISRLRSGGLTDAERDLLARMVLYYERYGFRGNANVLGWLLRRPPTSLASFALRMESERLAARRNG